MGAHKNRLGNYALCLFFQKVFGTVTIVDAEDIVVVDTRAVKTGKYMSTIKTSSLCTSLTSAPTTLWSTPPVKLLKWTQMI